MYLIQQHRMLGKNSGVCYGCKSVGHFFDDYMIKRRYPRCMYGFFRSFYEVTKGKFFKHCSVECRFWEWFKDGEAIGESSNGNVTFAKPTTHKEIDNMSQMFQSQVRLNNKKELLISVNVNMKLHREKSPIEGKMKGTNMA